jgi:hypothetical protein
VYQVSPDSKKCVSSCSIRLLGYRLARGDRLALG